MLLISELGCGNTQLAKAINAELGWYLLHQTVSPKMEAQDLIYRFDATKRLSDAHSENRINAQPNEVTQYYDAGVLWEALSWETAIKAGRNAKNTTETTTTTAGFLRHCVVLDMDDENLAAEWLVNSRTLDYYDLNIKHNINYLNNIKNKHGKIV